MGIFDVFKKNRKMDTAEIHVSEEQQEPESTDTAEAENDAAIEEKDMDRILKWIREKTAATAYRLTVNTDQKPGLSDTKFGGVPYWNPEMEYPRDSEGAPLALLAQLNMKDFSGSPMYEILWGDCGVAGFFVNREDLKKWDFSKVMYNWDCC